MTHGFFIIMGGFHLFEHGSIETSDNDMAMLHEDDIPLHPLSAGNLNREDTSIDIDFSSFTVPTEAEIRDRGKGDWIAKSLVLLQTSWFLMQCIARAIEHLPVTQLEIVTFAYAAINIATYIFWWNKPLNIDRPVRVFRKSEALETQPPVNEPIPQARKLTWKTIGDGLSTMIITGEDDDVDLSSKDRVPMFWADYAGYDTGAIPAGLGACFGMFGGIHCIAWGFPFPTHIESLTWDIASATLIAVPVYVAWMPNLGYFLGRMMDSAEFGDTVDYFVAFSGGILYILARAVTLVLAFTSLRELPPGAFDTVHWTTFIPHIS